MAGYVEVKARIYSVLLWVFCRNKNFIPFGLYFFSKTKSDGKLEAIFELGSKPVILLKHKQLKINFLNKSCFFGFYKIFIDTAKLEDAEIHNSLKITLHDEQQGYFSGIRNNPVFQIVMSLFMWRYIVLRNGKSIFIRLSPNFRTIVTVRNTVISDARSKQIKLTIVGLCGFFLFWLPNKWRPVLMYEKESEKFEESASILFQYIKSKGHKNVYFIISEEGLKKYTVPEELREGLLIKGSFKHYLFFFISKKFIGTEAPAHAIDLRIVHVFAVLKLRLKKMQFVFLQHGVMYMVSLASDTRKTFRRGKLYPLKTKVVVSSELEAQHFIQDGEYLPTDLYITGLPKFDNPIHHADAESIVVMPTWRPWEYNLIGAKSYQESGYYKMIRTIVDAVPSELLSKLIVLPHPLFAESLIKSDLKKYMVIDTPYEQILRDCTLLITDYSSISFDAFNRGSNVIFWWADKDECMKQYSGHLMLTEELAFGQVVYEKTGLETAIKKLYQAKRPESYIRHFRKLVHDFDGKSTSLLYQKLQQEKFI